MSDTVEETPANEPRPLPEHPVLRQVLERFEQVGWETSHDQDVVTVEPSDLLDLAGALKQAGFEMLSDLTAVDWFRRRPVRFEVVVNLLSMQHRLRLRLLVPVGGDQPAVPSLCGVWPGANYPEREVYDMFGIVFDGHPDLTRILMPDDWEGHPLRKDEGVGSVPVQFKASHRAE